MALRVAHLLMPTGIYKELYKTLYIPTVMSNKKQITVRVNEELLKALKQKYSYLTSDSEIIRLAMSFLDMKGGK